MKWFPNITALSVSQDRLSEKVKTGHFRDALATELTQQELSPAQLQYNIFAYMPTWVNGLMKLRNFLVKKLGFEVGQETMSKDHYKLEVGQKAGFLTIVEIHHNEIISFAEDQHMEFYLSVIKTAETVIVSTLVNPKNRIGKLYLSAVLPFHHLIARTVINNSAKAGRI